MPRVTVITPAHDSAGTIDATIASVVAQRFSDWEHVVCDDASTDDTVERVRARAADDPRVQLVCTPRNGGPAAARNLALDRASGELVAFLDADDRLEPTYLETMVARYDAEPPGVGIVCCDAWREDAAGRRLGRYSALNGGADGADLTMLLRRNPILVASLCPRAVVEDVGRFSTECFGSEDHDLWLRIAEAGYRVAYVDAPLVIYRVAAGSVSASALRMARTDQRTFERALRRGRLDRRQAAIARDRLALARAAEAVARGAKPSDAITFASAVRARVRQRLARD